MGEPEGSVQAFMGHAQGHEQAGQLWASAGIWHLWWSLGTGEGFLGSSLEVTGQNMSEL